MSTKESRPLPVVSGSMQVKHLGWLKKSAVTGSSEQSSQENRLFKNCESEEVVNVHKIHKANGSSSARETHTTQRMIPSRHNTRGGK